MPVDSSLLQPVEGGMKPPIIIRKAGRPKIKRMRFMAEKAEEHKLTFEKCLGRGHNIRTCKYVPPEAAPIPTVSVAIRKKRVLACKLCGGPHYQKTCPIHATHTAGPSFPPVLPYLNDDWKDWEAFILICTPAMDILTSLHGKGRNPKRIYGN